MALLFCANTCVNPKNVYRKRSGSPKQNNGAKEQANCKLNRSKNIQDNEQGIKGNKHTSDVFTQDPPRLLRNELRKESNVLQWKERSSLNPAQSNALSTGSKKQRYLIVYIHLIYAVFGTERACFRARCKGLPRNVRRRRDLAPQVCVRLTIQSTKRWTYERLELRTLKLTRMTGAKIKANP